MAGRHERRVRAGEYKLAPIARGLVLGGWLIAADAWIKSITRLAACDGTGRWPSPWSTPATCTATDLVGRWQLEPAASDAFLGLTLAGRDARLGYAAAIAVVCVGVAWWLGRGRGGLGGAGTALGCALAGIGILAAPIALGDGRAWSEFIIGHVRFGIGDIALIYALLWMIWARWRGA